MGRAYAKMGCYKKAINMYAIVASAADCRRSQVLSNILQFRHHSDHDHFYCQPPITGTTTSLEIALTTFATF